MHWKTGSDVEWYFHFCTLLFAITNLLHIKINVIAFCRSSRQQNVESNNCKIYIYIFIKFTSLCSFIENKLQSFHLMNIYPITCTLLWNQHYCRSIHSFILLVRKAYVLAVSVALFLSAFYHCICDLRFIYFLFNLLFSQIQTCFIHFFSFIIFFSFLKIQQKNILKKNFFFTFLFIKEIFFTNIFPSIKRPHASIFKKWTALGKGNGNRQAEYGKEIWETIFNTFNSFTLRL